MFGLVTLQTSSSEEGEHRSSLTSAWHLLPVICFHFKAENSSVASARIASTGWTLFYSFQEVATKKK